MAARMQKIWRGVCDGCEKVLADGCGGVIKKSTLKELIFELISADWQVTDNGMILKCWQCVEEEENDTEAQA